MSMWDREETLRAHQTVSENGNGPIFPAPDEPPEPPPISPEQVIREMRIRLDICAILAGAAFALALYVFLKHGSD